MFSKLSKAAARRAISTAIMAAILGAAVPVSAQTEPAQKIHLVVKDIRNIEEASVRFSAAQGTQNAPNIALLGANQEIWPKIRGAVLESEAAGYPVRAILVGPPTAAPALEIYAKGRLVTNPIDPYKITRPELVKLIRDIYKQFYSEPK